MTAHDVREQLGGEATITSRQQRMTNQFPKAAVSEQKVESETDIINNLQQSIQ